MTHGQIPAERIIVEAVRAARPDVRNIALDLGTIRWTDPKTCRRVTFATPGVVRDRYSASPRVSGRNRSGLFWDGAHARRDRSGQARRADVNGREEIFLSQRHVSLLRQFKAGNQGAAPGRPCF